jgi:restriction system protein
MAVPTYQEFMLPLLRLAADGAEHSISDAVDEIALKLGISEEDQNELLPSGTQTRFSNRVSWAGSYLRKAGLLQSTGRGRFRNTERGIEALRSSPSVIDNTFLEQFPEFVEFKRKTSVEQPEGDQEPARDTQTPQEVLESSYQSLRRTLAQELLERAKKSSPRFFERLVVDLLVAMGYGGSRADAGQAVGRSGDGGIDGIIKEDRLGFDAVLVQAKRWDAAVGRPVVQAFAGSLEGQRARKGVLITTSTFTKDARDYVGRIEKRIVLIDGEQLAQLMIDFGVAVTDVANYRVKRVDADYFGDGDE